MTTVSKHNVKTDYERARIVEHAAKVFLTRGYDGTTMEHIAREMKVTKGFIYYYFSSKAEVFYELHSRAIEDARAFVMSNIPADASPVAKLRAAITAQVTLAAQRPAFGGVAGRTAWTLMNRNFPAEYRDKLMEKRNYLRKLYEDIIREGVEAEAFLPVDAGILIKLVMGAITWLPTWYRPNGKVRPEELGDVLCRMMLGHLNPNGVLALTGPEQEGER